MINLEVEKKKMYDIIGAIHDVHKYLGPGLNESCYQEAMELQLKDAGVIYKREVSFHPTYRGVALEATFRIDFLCNEDVIIECKAVPEIIPSHRAQLFNYMRLLEKPCGILVNFLPKFDVVERYFYDKGSRNIIAVDGHIIKNFQEL